MSVISRTEILLLLGFIILIAPVSQDVRAADVRAHHFRCESSDATQDARVRLVGVHSSKVSAGALVLPRPLTNNGSWQFDGNGAIAFAVPSNSNWPKLELLIGW